MPLEWTRFVHPAILMPIAQLEFISPMASHLEKSGNKKTLPQTSGRNRILLILASVAMCGFLLTQRDAIREHQLYFSEDRKNVTFQLADLSEAWTEKTLREKFPGIPLNCSPNPGQGLGDLACGLDTKSFNGVPALFISFFFTRGHLQQVSINVPWWRHGTGYNYLVSSLGQPTASQLLPYSGIRLHGWSLPSGAAIFYNRDKSINPFSWNAINWRSASSCAAETCFTAPTK